jgi:hypothetical protein
MCPGPVITVNDANSSSPQTEADVDAIRREGGACSYWAAATRSATALGIVVSKSSSVALSGVIVIRAIRG